MIMLNLDPKKLKRPERLKSVETQQNDIVHMRNFFFTNNDLENKKNLERFQTMFKHQNRCLKGITSFMSQCQVLLYIVFTLYFNSFKNMIFV